MALRFISTVSEATSDVVLSAQTVYQYSNIEPVDLTSSVPSGSKAYFVDRPEGVEAMRDSLRIIGAPVSVQASTTHNIYIVPPTGDPFWCVWDLTVEAHPGPVRSVSTADEMYALAEFGTSYTGPGCIVEIAAGATIDRSTGPYNNNSRFAGLTTPIIIKSADPGNRATILGWDIQGVARKVSMVDLDFHKDQDPAYSWGDRVNGVMNVYEGFEDISIVRCRFTSNVPPASDLPAPYDEVVGVLLKPGDRATIWDCEFSDLFNGVHSTCSNLLVGKLNIHDHWGDAFRMSSRNTTTSYIMFVDSHSHTTVADGRYRHTDGVQAGGEGFAGVTLSHVEIRGLVAADTDKPEGPAINWSGSALFEASTNQSADTDGRIYRMKTGVAGSNLTVQLPDPSTVADGTTYIVQKYSTDTSYSVTVARGASENIDGVASDYVISGPLKAVRFTKASSGNWGIEVYGRGAQLLLLQDDGGLASMSNVLIWHCGATMALAAGVTFEVKPVGAVVENVTTVPANYGDVDGDGLIDRHDYAPTPGTPQMSLANNDDDTVDLTFRKSVTVAINSPASLLGTFTSEDNTTGIVSSDFVGNGALSTDRIQALLNMQPVEGGAIIGTGRGAIQRGLQDGGYDWINRRPRYPFSATCTQRPVISDDGSTFSIDTAATFSAAGAPTYQWLLDNEPISGQTGTTLAHADAGGTGLISLRVTLPDATYDDPCSTDSNQLTLA